MALSSATNTWLTDIDDGYLSGTLLVDLSRAFDTVFHKVLLPELSEIGCTANTLSWFGSYLNERLQRVILGSETTDWLEVSRGVPQGSSLSPLLFNIYMRKLPSTYPSRITQFTDDITQTERDTDPLNLINKLSTGYKATKEFCNSHELQINENKTQLIIFKAPGKKLPEGLGMEIDGCVIKPLDSMELLGVTLDRHLNMNLHIEQVVRKCKGLLGILRRAAAVLPEQLLKLAYTALIRTHLEYCSTLLYPASPSELQKLDGIQKLASRIICGAPRDGHSEPLQQLLRLESLKDRRTEHVLQVVMLILNKRCHPGL